MPEMIGERFVRHKRIARQLVCLTAADMPLGLGAQELDGSQAYES